MDHLSKLNESQLEAATTTEGFLRVIAGAGSGKTKLLVSRYAYLVRDYGINSANILCVTFTNKAAGEMRRRIRALIGDEYDTSLICTYHGFCVRVLRDDIEKLFYPKDFQIIDESEQKSILGEIYRKYELKLDHASFEKVLRDIASIKSRREYVSRMCDPDKGQIMESVTTLNDRIIEEYLERQRQTYSLDFSDLMYFALHLFERFDEVREKWQERLNYIEVDEFQDSSGTEMELVDVLAGKHGNMMIVGDPDQNIYEWRGSDVKLLVDFDKTHPGTKTVFLSQNYRSTPQILTCANTLIDKNELRLKKDLFTHAELGAQVIHYHEKTEYAEARRIVEQITHVRQTAGGKFADFAVLYRSGFLSRIVEKIFTENGIPYEIYGGVKFYQRMEIQDIMSYLRLIAFDSDSAFKRIINTPRRRFGRAKMQKLISLQSDGSLFETLAKNLDDHELGNSGAGEFVSMIASLRERIGSSSLSDFIEAVCTESGYEKYIKELGDMERFENVSEFKRISAEYEKNFGEDVSLSDFIGQIALQAEDTDEEEADKVKLMTIHAAKGLEFDNVFVIGLSEGVFPSSKTIEERKQLGLEEERRLCYVAITRAKKRLFLTDSEGFSQSGAKKLPSRFLDEIGVDNYRRIGVISKELADESRESIRKTSFSTAESAAHVPAIGERVTHPAFGDGTVIEAGSGSLKIRFDRLSSPRDISSDFFIRKSITAEVRETESFEEETVKEEFEDESEEESETPDTVVTPNTADYDNLWERDDVPKSGWICTGISDLGAPVGVCEMCGHQIIRYVHHMSHPDYRSLGVGCICAGKMEGNIDAAKQREAKIKSRTSRLENFRKRKWKLSKNKNEYLKINGHVIVIYNNSTYHYMKYSIDGEFCPESYYDRNSLIDDIFKAVEKLK